MQTTLTDQERIEHQRKALLQAAEWFRQTAEAFPSFSRSAKVMHDRCDECRKAAGE